MHYAYFCIGFTFLITVCSGLWSKLFAFSEPTLGGREGCALEVHWDLPGGNRPQPTSLLPSLPWGVTLVADAMLGAGVSQYLARRDDGGYSHSLKALLSMGGPNG